MRLLYDILVPLAAAAAAPVWLARSLRHPELRAHMAERTGALPAGMRERLSGPARPPLWIQAVSVGEVQVARTLLEALGRDRAGSEAGPPCVISSTTPAGRQAAAALGDSRLLGVFHPPLDWTPWVRRALEAVRPGALICVETEIWPALYSECLRRAIPVLLVNGRLSERSFRRYRALRRWLSGPLSAVRLACMQTQGDAGRAEAIGIGGDRIVVTGNMKFDAPPPDDLARRRLRTLFGLPEEGGPPVIVAGSTSAGEEELVLQAWSGSGHPEARLILAPRHSGRFEEVARLLERRGISFVRRSSLPSQAGWQVALLDTIGELDAVYALGQVAFVGGSLVPRGGQNMIEPARQGVPVLFGPHTDHFAAVADALIQQGAAARVQDAAGLGAQFGRFLSDPGLRRRCGEAGRRLAEEHRGATLRTLRRLAPFLG